MTTTLWKREQEMLAYYRARAPLMQYDAVSPGVARVLESYAAYFNRKLAGRRVLEVACGTGFWTQRLARHAESVTAVDAAPEMLQLARSRQYVGDNVDFVLADAYALDGITDNFDGGFHFQWISHVPRSRLSAFFRAFHEKLSAGSVVVIGDNNDEGSERDSHGDLYQQRTLPDGSRHQVVKNWLKPDELHDLLRPHIQTIEFTAFEKDWFASYTLR